MTYKLTFASFEDAKSAIAKLRQDGWVVRQFDLESASINADMPGVLRRAFESRILGWDKLAPLLDQLYDATGYLEFH